MCLVFWSTSSWFRNEVLLKSVFSSVSVIRYLLFVKQKIKYHCNVKYKLVRFPPDKLDNFHTKYFSMGGGDEGWGVYWHLIWKINIKHQPSSQSPPVWVMWLAEWLDCLIAFCGLTHIWESSRKLYNYVCRSPVTEQNTRLRLSKITVLLRS